MQYGKRDFRDKQVPEAPQRRRGYEKKVPEKPKFCKSVGKNREAPYPKICNFIQYNYTAFFDIFQVFFDNSYIRTVFGLFQKNIVY